MTAPAERHLEKRSGNIASVLPPLKDIKHKDVGPLLTSKLAHTREKVDPRAGIVLVDLAIPPVTTSDGLEFEFHAARVLQRSEGAQDYVNPHYHLIGEEPYVILSGEGEMNIGRVEDGKVAWGEPRKVVAGDVIEVQEGEVHSLRNIGKEPLDFVFACPHNHLVDNAHDQPEGDRYFTMELEDGIPPWYPKQ